MTAINDGGIALVNRGTTTMIAMVKATKPPMISKGLPESQVVSPFTTVLNWSSCDMKITTASPFTKPYMTGCGTSLTNLASLNRPTRIWIAPASATAASTYSIPLDCISAIKTITVAPAPPEINPGLPPKIAVTSPMMKAPYNPIKGGKPARIAKDKDSGIMVMATVIPASTSVR